MNKFLLMAIPCLAFLLLTACRDSQKNKPIWEQVKITDLVPYTDEKAAAVQPLKTINFDVCVFEIPAENIGALNGIWQTLSTQPVHFNNYEAFRANSFLIGFGQPAMWDRVDELLVAAGSKETETNYLLLPDGRAEQLAVVKLRGQQTIFYVPISGRMEGAVVGPGTLVLRMKAEKITGSRGVCDFAVQPVFLSSVRSAVGQPAARERAGEMIFDSVGFELKMGPGDFFLLGPERYVSDQVTLSSLFFTKPAYKPVVRIFLFVCAGITD